MENGREKPLKSGAKRVDFFYRIVYNNNDAEMAERSNAHDSKSCDAGMYPRVQIPLSAPNKDNPNLKAISVGRAFGLFFIMNL